MKGKWCQDLQFLLSNGLQSTRKERKKCIWDLWEPSCCAELLGGLSVAVAVGVTNMCQVKRNTRHMKGGT